MAFPFVAARFDYGQRVAPALALVVHMAEGGGTVGYLSRQPARGVSVHYVIEYSGRIVQMLPLDRVSGSINPALLRTGNDVPFIGYNGEFVRYGVIARKLVLGAWDHNPNQAIITVEVEGRATRGPNIAQRHALAVLTRSVLDDEPTVRGLLGHRDFQDYKACPGKLIPWALMSVTTGHGRHGLIRP
jgi:N-acetyl-anhydromuramyl-L-alanine amidase AmpD